MKMLSVRYENGIRAISEIAKMAARGLALCMLYSALSALWCVQSIAFSITSSTAAPKGVTVASKVPAATKDAASKKGTTVVCKESGDQFEMMGDHYVQRVESTFFTPAREAIILDLSTNTILFEKNSRARTAPSSMTKVMTLLMAFEALKNGDIRKNDMVTVSKYAAQRPGSRMVLYPMQSVELDYLLRGIAAVSGNDACSALAEFMGGTEESFAEMMTEKAREMGAKDSHFSNASGLPDPQHWSTCWDLAIIAWKTLEAFPQEYKEYYSIQSFTFNRQTQRNKNVLLKDGAADGMKTGQTDAGKCGMIASAENNKRRVLVVVNGVETPPARASEVRRMLAWAFAFFRPAIFVEKGQVVAEIPVWQHRNLKVIANERLALSVPKRYWRNISLELRYMAPLLPPVHKGQVVAKLIVMLPKHREIALPLVASEEVKELSFFEKLFQPFWKIF